MRNGKIGWRMGRKSKPTRHDWRDYYDEYFYVYYSQCADSSWVDRDPMNIEEGFQHWLVDEGIISWDESDYESPG